MASKLLRRIAGAALVGGGQYLTNHAAEQREMRGFAMRQAYEDRRAERQMAFQRQMAQEGRDFTASQAQLGRDFSAEQAGLTRDAAVGNREDSQAHSKEMAKMEADLRREMRRMDIDDNRAANLAKQAVEFGKTVDENGLEAYDPEMSRAFTKGVEHFGREPTRLEAEAWVDSNPNPDRREWGMTWDRLRREALAQVGEDADDASLRDMMQRMRDHAASKGLQVPQGDPPQAPSRDAAPEGETAAGAGEDRDDQSSDDGEPRPPVTGLDATGAMGEMPLDGGAPGTGGGLDSVLSRMLGSSPTADRPARRESAVPGPDPRRDAAAPVRPAGGSALSRMQQTDGRASQIVELEEKRAQAVQRLNHYQRQVQGRRPSANEQKMIDAVQDQIAVIEEELRRIEGK